LILAGDKPVGGEMDNISRGLVDPMTVHALKPGDYPVLWLWWMSFVYPALTKSWSSVRQDCIEDQREANDLIDW